MRRRVVLHDGGLWARLYQTVKVEEPVTFDELRRWCRDVRPWDVERVLSEMVQAGRLECAREWIDFVDGRASQLKLVYWLKGGIDGGLSTALQ